MSIIGPWIQPILAFGNNSDSESAKIINNLNRGIYFKNKSNIYNSNDSNKLYLQIKDIYQYLKQIDSDTFEQFLRIRKLMYNWVKHNNVEYEQELKKFNKISEKCDKVHFKLTAIFTNKLFPNIMQDDLPEINN